MNLQALPASIQLTTSALIYDQTEHHRVHHIHDGLGQKACCSKNPMGVIVYYNTKSVEYHETKMAFMENDRSQQYLAGIRIGYYAHLRTLVKAGSAC